MNKSELAKCLAEKMSVKQCTSLHFINALQKVLAEELRQNRTIMLQGFGSLTIWEQIERPGRNPRTGKPCMISARTSVKFKPGKNLLNVLNNNR